MTVHAAPTLRRPDVASGMEMAALGIQGHDGAALGTLPCLDCLHALNIGIGRIGPWGPFVCTVDLVVDAPIPVPLNGNPRLHQFTSDSLAP